MWKKKSIFWELPYLKFLEVRSSIDVMHVTTDGLVAADPELIGTLWGDKVHSTLFDNSKLRSLVPQYRAEVSFADGIAESGDEITRDGDRSE